MLLSYGQRFSDDKQETCTYINIVKCVQVIIYLLIQYLLKSDLTHSSLGTNLKVTVSWVQGLWFVTY